jgi:hypothetical protein
MRSGRAADVASDRRGQAGGGRRFLNLTTGYVSQLERGAKRATGPTLVLLNLIRRKGIEAIL